MNIDYEQVLLWATLVTGVLCLLDLLIFAPLRRRKFSQAFPSVPRIETKPFWLLEYARSFFPLLLIVLLLRSFLVEPFRIPSSSLEPTLLKGDFIIANKYDYGLRLPVFRSKLLNVGMPQRGDIIVFRYPPDPHLYFIKRVIGIPGDRIDYVDKTLSINGQQLVQTSEPTLPAEKTIPAENGGRMTVIEKQEDLLGVRHQIYVEPAKPANNFQNMVVPQGMYMVMGDNRDNSADSRYWGYVPEENVVGKAVFIWMSWDSHDNRVRWSRIGTRI